MKEHKTIVFCGFSDIPDVCKTGKYKVISIDLLRNPKLDDFVKYTGLMPSIQMTLAWRTELANSRTDEPEYTRDFEIAEKLATANFYKRYREEVLGRLDVERVVDDLFDLADGKIPLVVAETGEAEKSTPLHLVFDWLDKADKSKTNCDVEMFDGSDVPSPSSFPTQLRRRLVTVNDETIKCVAIDILEEFNRYRRGAGEYMWNEDPAKNRPLSLTPAEIGEAIDYAVKYMKEH